MTVIERALGHCTAHAAYEHDCPYCRDAELQVARWSDVKTDEALAATLRGAVAEIARLECALQQVRARFHESDMRGVRETLDAALDPPTTEGQSS